MALTKLKIYKKEFKTLFECINKYFKKELSKCDVMSIINKIEFPLHLDLGESNYGDMDKADVIGALLVLLIKSYNRAPADNLKESFYDLYNVSSTTNLRNIYFEVDSLGLSEIRIPATPYFPPRLFDVKHPNTTIIYEVNNSMNGSDFEDIITRFVDDRDSKVIIEFSKNFKFNNDINLVKFNWPNKNTIAKFYTIKDEEGNNCLPFKLIYIDDQKDLLNSMLKPIV